MFSVHRVTQNGNLLIIGSKWCMPNVTIPFSNVNIVSGGTYRVAARGNTNYYYYNGLDKINIVGTVSCK